MFIRFNILTWRRIMRLLSMLFILLSVATLSSATTTVLPKVLSTTNEYYATTCTVSQLQQLFRSETLETETFHDFMSQTLPYLGIKSIDYTVGKQTCQVNLTAKGHSKAKLSALIGATAAVTASMSVVKQSFQNWLDDADMSAITPVTVRKTQARLETELYTNQYLIQLLSRRAHVHYQCIYNGTSLLNRDLQSLYSQILKREQLTEITMHLSSETNLKDLDMLRDLLARE